MAVNLSCFNSGGETPWMKIGHGHLWPHTAYRSYHQLQKQSVYRRFPLPAMFDHQKISDIPKISKHIQNNKKNTYARCMVYLPTKLGHLWGKNYSKYEKFHGSHMELMGSRTNSLGHGHILRFAGVAHRYEQAEGMGPRKPRGPGRGLGHWRGQSSED